MWVCLVSACRRGGLFDILSEFRRDHPRIDLLEGWMAVELLTGLGLLFERPPGLSWGSLGLGLGLLALNWAATALLFVPLHGRLRPRDPGLGRLVGWNWVRTLSWTVRGGWILVVLLQQQAVEVPAP